MMSEPNRELVTDLAQAYKLQDLQQAARLCAPDYEGIDVGRAQPQHGPDGMRAALEDYMQAFPDLEVRLEDTIVDVDHVVQVWTATGTHLGQLMNIPATGRRVNVRGISVLTLADGRVRKGFYLWDGAALLRSIGLLPEL